MVFGNHLIQSTSRKDAKRDTAESHALVSVYQCEQVRVHYQRLHSVRRRDCLPSQPCEAQRLDLIGEIQHLTTI